ncbi:MAG TPA: AMIN domain-containing protein, partial [Gemmatimonadales bacterium]|nr:AMIN domain-containing protein [Gemmatimonadales bacterium]
MTRRLPEGMVHAALVVAIVLFPGVGTAADPGAPGLAPAARLHDVTVVDQPDALLVRVKTAGPAKYRAELVDSPYRLVVDLEDTVYAWRKTPLIVGREPVRQVRGGQYQGDVARVVVELTRKVGYVVRADDDGLAIVVPRASATPVVAGRIVPISTSMNGLRTANALAVPTANGHHAPAAEAPRPLVAQGPAPAPADSPQPAPEVTKAPAPVAPRPIQVAQTAKPAAGPRPPVTLEFKDADIVSLLRVLATEGGRNIVIGEDVKGKMSISLRNVPWELALQTILESRGLERVERDGILRIATREQLTKEAETTIRMRDVEAKLAESSRKPELRGPLREETLRLYYTDAEEVAKTLQGILGIEAEGARSARVSGPTAGPIAEPPFSQLFGPPPPPPPPGAQAPQPPPEVLFKGLTIRAHRPTNTLFLRLYQADIERVKTLVKDALDIPLPQVKIEARMEILDRSALEQIGVQWGGAFAAPVNSSTVVGRGFESAGSSALIPGGIPIPPAPVGFTPGNPGLTLANALPVSAATGLPLGGNLVNLPISALPTAGALPAAGLAFGIVGTRFNVNLALQALATQNKTRTLARPEVVTVENAKAVMSLGEEIPYATVSSAGTQIQFKEALLKLEVTPAVIRDGDITKIKLVVVVENNSRGAVVNLGSAGSPPAINRRKAET